MAVSFDPMMDIDDVRRVMFGKPFDHLEFLLKAKQEKVMPIIRGTGERILPRVRVKMGRLVTA